MAVRPLAFTKSWMSKEDFPTFEENETQVRTDMEELHVQTRDYINNTLIADIKAPNIPMEPIDGVNTQSVQSAVANLQTNIIEIVADPRFLPDASVSAEKLAADLVIDCGTY
jgi:hypothetical protein